MRRLREDLDNDVRRPGCHRCWENEKTGYSTRTWANEWIFKDHTGPARLTALEISAGRTCTLKCRMCGPDSSTAWASEMDQRGVGEWKPTLDWNMLPRHLLADLTYLKITGGEPFLSPNLARLFLELSEDGLSHNIDVELFTNVEEFPGPRYVDNMRDFKSLQIYFSVDGIGARNEYIRSGSIWQRTVENMKSWGRWKSELGLGNVKFHISYTYTLYNCMYCAEFIDTIRGLRAYPGLEGLTLINGSHMATDDSWHSVPRLPASIRSELVDTASEFALEVDHRAGLPGSLPGDYVFYPEIVIKSLSNEKHAPPSLGFDDWWRETTEIDAYRGQDIRRALPEVVELLRRHGLIRD